MRKTVFKIQFFVCIDNFEQYFDTSLPVTLNDLQSFVNNMKNVHPLKNTKLKLSVISGFSNMVYGKKRKLGNAGNQRKAL